MAIAPSTQSSWSSKETRSARRSPLAPSHEYSLCSVNQWRSASLQILFSGFQRRGHSRGWAPLTRCPGRCPGTQGSSPRPMREQNQGHHGAPWVTTGQQCIGSNQDETHNSENQIESIVWLLSTYSMSLLQSLRTWRNWGILALIASYLMKTQMSLVTCCYITISYINFIF